MQHQVKKGESRSNCLAARTGGAWPSLQLNVERGNDCRQVDRLSGRQRHRATSIAYGSAGDAAAVWRRKYLTGLLTCVGGFAGVTLLKTVEGRRGPWVCRVVQAAGVK